MASGGTLDCLFCGGAQLYPGPRYEKHLIHEHGIIFHVQWVIQMTMRKKENNGALPLPLPECQVPSTDNHGNGNANGSVHKCAVCQANYTSSKSQAKLNKLITRGIQARTGLEL